MVWQLKQQEKKITLSLLFCFGTACRNKAVMTKTGWIHQTVESPQFFLRAETKEDYFAWQQEQFMKDLIVKV